MKRLYALLALLLCVALVLAYLWYSQSRTELDGSEAEELEYEEYQELKPEGEPTSEEGLDYLTDCRAVNADTVAWLEIPDTNVDFPVEQCEDNEYYLSHDLYGESSQYGVPFLDYRCSPDFTDYNSIVYGHNIRGERMFATLLDFQDEEYFRAHSYGYLTTADAKYRVEFVACLVVPSDGFVYDVVFLDERSRVAFADALRTQAKRYRDFPDVDLTAENLLTLSTCSYEYTDARTVLVGFLERL
jgi:sortase B